MAAKAEKMEKYRNMNQNELEIQERDLGEQIFRLRFQLSTGQAEGLKRLREARRGSRADQNAVARKRSEEKVMANETTATQQGARERGARQELTGVVTSAKMQKTIVVRVTRATQHPLYHRVVRSGKKYYAHDEAGEARVGDTVRIVSTRPLSKLKRWRLKQVLSRSTRVQ